MSAGLTVTSNSRHVWEAPRGRGALGGRRLPTSASAKVQLARRAASPCEDARDLGEKGGKTRGKELSGFFVCVSFLLFSFLFFGFFFYVCALKEATSSREDWVSRGDPQKRTSQSRGQRRCVAESQGLPLCLTPGHKITARVGRYAHLAYLSARSKCKR